METKEVYETDTYEELTKIAGEIADGCSLSADGLDIIVTQLRDFGQSFSQVQHILAEYTKKLIEYDVLDAWLHATFGNLDTGDTLQERVENVVRHYATQLGRWAGG